MFVSLIIKEILLAFRPINPIAVFVNLSTSLSSVLLSRHSTEKKTCPTENSEAFRVQLYIYLMFWKQLWSYNKQIKEQGNDAEPVNNNYNLHVN